MTKEELRLEWEARVEAFNASGKSQSAFCAENGIHIKWVGYWLRKHRTTNQVKERKSSQWLKLEVGDNEVNLKSNRLNVRVGKVIIKVTQLRATVKNKENGQTTVFGYM